MKKTLSFIVLGLLCLAARAIPADPTPIVVTQPDGSTLTVTLHGDEFFHYTTTSDGYTVVKNKAGYYTYARLDGGRLVPGDRVARDESRRSAADRAALQSIPKRLTSPLMAHEGAQKLQQRNNAMKRVGAEGMMDYDNFRGLIILVNYTDKKFSMPEASAFYDDMVNTHDYTGYTLHNRKVNMTGSVRDYFYDNSYQIFDPHFDVVGPVDVNFSCRYPQSTANSDAVFNAALAAVDNQIDFNDYDSDGDGYVDMVFFLVAGYSSNYGGNDESYLWPHMYYLYWSPPLDGVHFGLYACSTEIAGWEGSYSDVNGIGTFCHEFGHVLGLPDLYDTDYEGSGGESRNPGNWSVMAGGSGSNFGRNPVGYSLYERYALGFTQPEVLESGAIEMQPLDTSNKGYRLNTVNPNEFFLIENRQPGKWDRFLPGHGMMVARVDSSNVQIWEMNQVNCNPNRMYYELLRADYIGRDSESDAFPGSSNVTWLTNKTTPNLQTWNHLMSDLVITDIAENGSLVSFNVVPDTTIRMFVEDFETMTATNEMNLKNVDGRFGQWNFSQCGVQTYENDGQSTLAVAMKKPSQLAMATPLNVIPFMMSFTVTNPTTSNANFRVYYSMDMGENWIEPANNVLSVKSKETGSLNVILPTTGRILVKINQTEGHAKKYCYLDDIRMYYDEYWAPCDVNSDSEVNIVDVNTVISIILGSEAGKLERYVCDVNGDGEVNIADVNLIINAILN